MIAEVEIGSFTFEYDAELHEMYVAKNEEVAAMVECVDEKQWLEFVEATK